MCVVCKKKERERETINVLCKKGEKEKERKKEREKKCVLCVTKEKQRENINALCKKGEREREGESVCLNGENSFFDRPQMLLMPLQRPTNTHSTEMEVTK